MAKSSPNSFGFESMINPDAVPDAPAQVLQRGEYPKRGPGRPPVDRGPAVKRMAFEMPDDLYQRLIVLKGRSRRSFQDLLIEAVEGFLDKNPEQ